MPEHELIQLADDIAANGQRDPGIVFEGQILDGWHRYQACWLAGVEFRYDVLPLDADPVAFVLSKNLHRRQMTAGQRAAAVVAARQWRAANPAGKAAIRRGGEIVSPSPYNVGDTLPTAPETTGEIVSPLPATNASMAEEAGTTARTIQQAKIAHKAGLGDAVRDGKVSVDKAAKIAKKAPELAAKVAAGELPPEDAVEAIKPKREKPTKRQAEPAATPEADVAALIAERDALRAEVAELREQLRDMADELEARVAFEGDGGVKAMSDLMTLNKTMKVSIHEYQLEKLELVREVKALRRRLARYEKVRR